MRAHAHTHTHRHAHIYTHAKIQWRNSECYSVQINQWNVNITHTKKQCTLIHSNLSTSEQQSQTWPNTCNCMTRDACNYTATRTYVSLSCTLFNFLKNIYVGDLFASIIMGNSMKPCIMSCTNRSQQNTKYYYMSYTPVHFVYNCIYVQVQLSN